LSHRNAILRAKELGWPFVGIFEDDAYPVKGVVNEISFCLSHVPDKCDILILGNSYVKSSSRFSKTFYNSVYGYGSHAYIVF
jgi:GR25 family glycosyltransferase involved in LPS biosynthesis